MSVITVSRQFGSGGETIASLVAQQLGYDNVDKELLAEVAQLANTSETDVAAFDERDERGFRSFLRKLFLGSASYDYTVHYPFLWGGEPAGLYERGNPTSITSLTPADTVKYFHKVMTRLWQRDNVIIIGRGSQVVLRDKPNTIHVRCIASRDVRCSYAMREYGLSEERARERIREADKQREQYLKRYYEADWDDPTLYHLILNTGNLSREAAVAAIVACVQATG